MAVLEIGVTAALTAAAANWVILRRAGRRRSAGLPVPDEDDADTGPIPIPVLPGVVDETDDADGHRIYLNPWAAWDQDEPEEE